MRFKLRERWWSIRFTRLRGRATGWCSADKREILIHDRLTERKELELTLHELLHGAFESTDEAWVDEAARDMARLLWRLGWRKGG